jgi:hypothetical protein
MYFGYRCYNKSGQPLGWLYTYNNDTEYTWTEEKNLGWCKRWKTERGARKHFANCNARWNFISKGGYLKIEAMPQDDNRPAKIQHQEDRLIMQLNRLHLMDDDDPKVEKPMKLKLAQMLISLNVGDNVRYYPNFEDANTFELAQVEEVLGSTITIKEMKFRKIDGYPQTHQIPGYVMPDDDNLCKYLIGLWNIKNTDWGNISADKILDIANLLT